MPGISEIAVVVVTYVLQQIVIIITTVFLRRVIRSMLFLIVATLELMIMKYFKFSEDHCNRVSMRIK